MLFPSNFTKLLFGDESVKILNRYVDTKKYLLCSLSMNSISKNAALNVLNNLRIQLQFPEAERTKFFCRLIGTSLSDSCRKCNKSFPFREHLAVSLHSFVELNAFILFESMILKSLSPSHERESLCCLFGKGANYPVHDNFRMFTETQLAYFISTCPRIWGGF